MKTNNGNSLLDDLFAEAKVEAPKRSFTDTKSALLTGLAIGGAGLATAKIITSSILKSKFFIMSISAATILTSTVLVYQTAVKPNETISDVHQSEKQELAQVNTSMGASLPENLFIEAPEIELIAEDVEPDDSTVIINDDTVVISSEMINDIIEAIDFEKIEAQVEEIVEKAQDMDIEFNIDVEKIEEFEELVERIADYAEEAIDSIDTEELKSVIAEVEASARRVSAEISRELSNINAATRSVSVETNTYEDNNASELIRRSFAITNHTTDTDLEAFARTASDAGIDVRYDCKVWASKIKRLNMKLVIDNDNGKRYTTDYHIRNVKRNENFSFNITWYENTEGKAVKFSKRTECNINRSNSQCCDE